jgi:hypothetical protein
MPLTIREALQVGDINYAPWREIWVGQRVTDLVVNGVAPMFPIYGNWTYLDGIDQALFENPSMHNRFLRSHQVEKVVEKLRQARLLATEEASARDDYRLGYLDAHIYEAMLYAQDYVLLTDLAVCSTSEFVGTSLYSIPTTLNRTRNVSPAYYQMYSDPALLSRYLFDLCYGAHTLHTRVGAVHSDIHVNNATLYLLSNQYKGVYVDDHTREYTPCYKNPVIAYVVGSSTGGSLGETNTYVFPHDGWFACLIDFSRVIIGPAARPKLVAEKGEAYALGFYRDQVTRALRTLHFYVPAFVEKYQDRLKGLLYADFEAVFRVMTAVDFLAIGRNFGANLRELSVAGNKTVFKVAPEGIRKAAEIERMGLEHIITHLTTLVEGGGQQGNIPYAGETVLPAVFGEYRYPAWASGKTPAGFALDQATLVSVYNGGGELQYSGTNYEQYPPWARIEVLDRLLQGEHMWSAMAGRDRRPFLESIYGPQGHLEFLQEQVRRTLDGNSPAETSSWVTTDKLF